MLTFTDMLHFLAHKFPCLSGRRLAFALVLACPLNYLIFWHGERVSRPIGPLDVKNQAEV